MLHMPGAVPVETSGVEHEDTGKARGICRAKSDQRHAGASSASVDRWRGGGNVVGVIDCRSGQSDVVTTSSMTRRVLWAGGWGDGTSGLYGLDTQSHVALSEGGAGPQSLAHSILRVMGCTGRRVKENAAHARHRHVRRLGRACAAWRRCRAVGLSGIVPVRVNSNERCGVPAAPP